jgi:hypothetical protein
MPAPYFSWNQRRLDRIVFLFRCDVDDGNTVKVQPALIGNGNATGKVVILNEPLRVLDQNPLSESVGSTARKGIRLVGKTDNR